MSDYDAYMTLVAPEPPMKCNYVMGLGSISPEDIRADFSEYFPDTSSINNDQNS